MVKGSSAGVSSDDNGVFDVEAPSNGTITVSSVGFTPSTIKVGGRTQIDVVLLPSNSSLDQVIVVGYGSQKRSDVTGSVARVSSATLQEVPTANFISELKGRTAGVDIVSNSSTPGGGGQIRIRGSRSMALTQSQSDGLDQPLVVVDGIPFGGSVNDIDPDNIVSLDILKDASATAIYGSRGSGGVILITTRRGRQGKAQMSYNGYYGISSVLGEMKTYNGKEYAQLKADAATYNSQAGQAGTTSYPLTAAEQAGLAKGTNTDWQKLIYRNAMTTSNSLSLSGGNETTQYSLGGQYYDEQGIIPNQNFERFQLRTTIDHNISKRLRIGINTIDALSYTNTPGGGGVPGTLIKLSPLTAPRNPDGSVNLFPLVGGIDANTYANPLTLKTNAAAILNRQRRLRTFNSLYGEWRIIDGLKYRLNVGLDYTQTQTDQYSGPNTFVNTNTSLASATATVANSEAYTYTLENILTYDKTFAEKHHLTVTGLFSGQKDHSQSSSFTGTGFSADANQDANLNLASTIVANAGTFAERGLISYMGRVNYGYADRYLLTATIRTDGASVLAPGHQYFSYPALAVGWNMMNEDFMKQVSFVNTLKLRGGWGKTSNQGVAPYTTLGGLTTSTYNFGQATPGQVLTYLVTSLPNPNLHWESTAQTNIGVDFGLLNNRISGTIDVYQQKTKDIILQAALPQSTGASSITSNQGRTEGKGIEINLSTVNIRAASGFTWSTDFNFSLNREKITALLPGEKSEIQNGWFVGQPLTAIYDVKKIGIWQTADSLSGALKAQSSPSQLPGQIKVQDISGANGKPDGKIDANDRQIIGNFQPKWEGGFTSRMSYKNFDFNFVIFARMGMKVLAPYLGSDGSAQGFTFFLQGRVNQPKVNYWTRSNPTNDFPRPDASLQSYPFSSTLTYQDGSFIKMRSINLGYTVPSKALSRAGITSLRIYVTALNPFILYSPFVHKGYGPDPEGNGYGGAISSSAAGGSVGVGGTNIASGPTTNGSSRQISVNLNNPSTRQYNVGVSLKF